MAFNLNLGDISGLSGGALPGVGTGLSEILESPIGEISGALGSKTKFRSLKRSEIKSKALLKMFEEPENIRYPLLRPVKPPRAGMRRSGDPFDFFGTLFTTPATAELNPMSLLNRTVI